MASWLAQIGLTTLPTIGGFAGSLITRNQVKTWYQKIEKPTWRPPNWLFGPVWTSLYLSMGYASYLIYRDGIGANRRMALGLYGAQLALNWAWTPIFFGAHKIGFAAIESTAMLAAIASTTWSFYSINKMAAYLMIPYAIWVSFATLLNIKIWQMNKNKKID